MSTPNTIEAPAIKKRGRPKKVVTEDVGTTKAAETTGMRLTSTKSTAAKEKVEKAKKAPAPTKTKTAANATTKKDALKPTTTASRATPVTTPPKSTVLDNASVTEAINAAEQLVAAPKPAAPQHPTPITPAAPTTSKILDQVRATGTLSSKPASSKPPIHPSQSQAAKPATPSILRPSQRTTTIPLPSYPVRAPSPKTAAPAPRPTPSAPGISRARSRMIEPTPDTRLPPKYKPAARRVTAIIVGIPIILVFGWELYGRWKGEVRKKWSDGGQRL